MRYGVVMELRKRQGRPASDKSRDLRADLLQASRLLLDESGPAALSMREVARRTGCTHQAPYHYFADRESILAALVAEGFKALAAVLETANGIAQNAGKRAALKASGAAYVGFAMSHPGTFRVMFRPDICNPERFPEVQAAGQRARDALHALARIVAPDGPEISALEMILWSHVHGLANLLVDGPLAANCASDADLSDQLDAVSNIFADVIISWLGSRNDQ